MCRLVSLMSMHTFESPTCLGNHEAKARAQQLEEARLLAEEKYKELQVGQCVECWSSVELCQFMSDHSWTRARRHILNTTWTELDYTLDASVNVAASHLLSKRRISSKVSQSFSKRKKCSSSKFGRHITSQSLEASSLTSSFGHHALQTMSRLIVNIAFPCFSQMILSTFLYTMATMVLNPQLFEANRKGTALT